MGAMLAALCVALMLSTAVLPFLSYAVPMIAGALIMVIVIECDRLWALAVYVAVSILSLLMVPDKTAGFAFLLYFGYYPVLKSLLEQKAPKAVEIIVKLANINLVVLGAFYAMLRIFGLDLEGVEFLAPYVNKWYVPILLILFASFFFFLYDTALSKAVLVYEIRLKKRFRKLFK